jgi:transposase
MLEDGKFILEVSKRVPKPAKYSPRDVLAVDVNERHIVVGNSKTEHRFETAVESCSALQAFSWKPSEEVPLPDTMPGLGGEAS